MNQQTFHTRQFFDSIASGYAKRYSAGNAYHRYFFNERLEAAACNLDLDNKSILDIGAGTGALYDYLLRTGSGFDYYASDISAAMLAQSKIPANKQLVGDITEIELPVLNFDFVFMLGVTSYMTRQDLIKTLHFVQKIISPEGLFIISFSNRCSLDFQIRKLLRTIAGMFKWIPGMQDKILSQRFSIRGYCLKELASLLPAGQYITGLSWLNQTFSPFNHLLPRPSVFIANFLKRRFHSTALISYLSADFLIVLDGSSSSTAA